jgi:hypothetical protein
MHGYVRSTAVIPDDYLSDIADGTKCKVKLRGG